jgi:curved DNA-binding protein CbpA
VPAKDPHAVLGVAPGAGPVEIKAAWRRLARRHHPDLTGDDPAASQRATRRMAEINTAYQALARGTSTGKGSRGGSRAETDDDAGPMRPPRREGRVPKPKPTRPVTGRLDTTDTFRPRNQTTSTGSGVLRGHAPRPHERQRNDLRASKPSGPTYRERTARDRPAAVPLDDAYAVELEFGKFHGHTLGEVAAFEPSYIDWLASTVTRDPDLSAAARSIRDELDRRGIVRSSRPIRPGWRSNPFV